MSSKTHILSIVSQNGSQPTKWVPVNMDCMKIDGEVEHIDVLSELEIWANTTRNNYDLEKMEVKGHT